MKSPDLQTTIDEVLLLHPRIAVLMGAGVSLAGPAALPIVDHIRSAIACAASDLDPELDNDGALQRRLASVQFELLMETLRRFVSDPDEDPITDLLVSIYNGHAPNLNHLLIRDLMDSQQIPIAMTTNFDTLVERDASIRVRDTSRLIEEGLEELRQGRKGSDVGLFHLHGSVEHPLELGAFQRRVGGPLTASDPRRQLLELVRSSMPLLLIGYRGSDRDIGPTLEAPGHEVLRTIRENGKRAPGSWVTNLVPDGDLADPQAVARRQVSDWVGSLRADRVDRFVAVVADITGHHRASVMHSKRAIKNTDTPGARACMASALSAKGLHGAAAQCLTIDRDPTTDLPGEIVGQRAFYMRNTGRFKQAEEAFETARRLLQSEVDIGRDRVPELFDVHWHAAEVSTLAASKGGHDAEVHRDRARASLERAAQLGLDHPTVATYFLDFVRGDFELLAGDTDAAVASWRRFQSESSPWLKGGGVIVSAQREAAALATAGDRTAALSTWRVGLAEANAARRATREASVDGVVAWVGAWAGLPAAAAEGSRVHQVQYLATIPCVILGGRFARSWLFFLRLRAATWVYPGLELLATSGPRIRRRLHRALRRDDLDLWWELPSAEG